MCVCVCVCVCMHVCVTECICTLLYFLLLSTLCSFLLLLLLLSTLCNFALYLTVYKSDVLHSQCPVHTVYCDNATSTKKVKHYLFIHESTLDHTLYGWMKQCVKWLGARSAAQNLVSVLALTLNGSVGLTNTTLFILIPKCLACSHFLWMYYCLLTYDGFTCYFHVFHRGDGGGGRYIGTWIKKIKNLEQEWLLAF